MSAAAPDSPPIRVLICGPAAALSEDPRFELVRAGSPAELRARLDEAAFDCAVLGLAVAGGADGLRAIARAAPSTALVVIASAPDEVRAAVRAGAHRCIPADVPARLLPLAVTEAIERRAAGPGPGLAAAETVLRLADTVEPRGHIERMSAYCALLAGPAGLDPELLRAASRLHDLGKVVVADAILGKPGPLTPAERREMERHAEVGCRLLAGADVEFLDLASEIAHTHHERYDGSGYPRRLAGEAIPAAGRAAALADAFDALTTDRVYRRALPFDEAVAAVRGERGRQFDPALVDALLAVLPDVREIMDRHPDAPAAPTGARGAELLTLQQAAATLGVSQSRLRRWSDEGRIRAVRTAGGHRRFRLDAVRRLAVELGATPAVRPLGPPAEALPTLASRLSADGPELVRAAVTSLYRRGQPGWFATPAAAPPAGEWVNELAAGCAAGRYTRTRRSTEALMRRAQLNGAGLLERHSFLERFAMVCQRALTLAGAPREEQALAGRLFAALQQTLLADRD